MHDLWPVLMSGAAVTTDARHLLHAALERCHPAVHRLLELTRRHDRPAVAAPACRVAAASLGDKKTRREQPIAM